MRKVAGKSMIGIEKELLIFLTAFSSGLFLRGTYRCLECFRDIVKHSFLAVGIEDLFYWIFVEMYLFVQIYHTSSGSALVLYTRCCSWSVLDVMAFAES